MKKILGLILGVVVGATAICAFENQDVLIFGNAGREASSFRLLEKYKDSHKVIALDGSFHWLRESHIIPSIVLGDFDSLTEEKIEGSLLGVVQHFKDHPPKDDELIFEPFKSGDILFMRAHSQNFTDLDKAIKYSFAEKARSIKLINVLGGERTDHSLHNMSTLKKFHDPHTPIHIETAKEILQFLKDESLTFNGTKDAKFGLFGFPKASATSTGLVWNLTEDYNLELGVQDSSCNVLADTSVTLDVKGEALLVRPNY